MWRNLVDMSKLYLSPCMHLGSAVKCERLEEFIHGLKVVWITLRYLPKDKSAIKNQKTI